MSRLSGDPCPQRARVTATPVVPILAVAVILLGWLVTQVARPQPASAHNSLVSSVPADGATVAAAPKAVTLTFDEPVGRRFGLVVVTGPDGRKVQQGALHVSGDRVRQPLGPLGPAGTYQVSWRVVSADGHPVSGTFAFRLRTAAGGTGTPKPTRTPTSTSTSGAAVPTATRSNEPGVVADSSNRSSPATLAVPLTAGLAALALVIGLGVRTRRRAHAASGGERSEHRDTPESRSPSDGD